MPPKIPNWICNMTDAEITNYLDHYAVLRGAHRIENGELIVDGTISFAKIPDKSLPFPIRSIKMGLFIRDAAHLSSLENFPAKVGSLTLERCYHLKDISAIREVPKCYINTCPITDLSTIPITADLEITRCDNFTTTKGCPATVETLTLSNCPELTKLCDLPNLNSLSIYNCGISSLSGLPDKIRFLGVTECDQLKALNCEQTNVESVTFRRCKKLKSLKSGFAEVCSYSFEGAYSRFTAKKVYANLTEHLNTRITKSLTIEASYSIPETTYSVACWYVSAKLPLPGVQAMASFIRNKTQFKTVSIYSKLVPWQNALNDYRDSNDLLHLLTLLPPPYAEYLAQTEPKTEPPADAELTF